MIYRFLKRILDFFTAVVGLVILAPLMLLIALMVRIDSRGPAIFVQDRIGKFGKPFRFYKFRTMRTEVDPYGFSPKDHRDPRITRIGGFLRKTSLDELPQLWNVIRGNMSMVGPRPLLPWQYEKWTEYQRRRCEVKPGLTGWAQIKGRGSLTHEDKIDLDIWYVENANLLLDAKIIFLTVVKVVKSEGILEEEYSRNSSEGK